MRAVGGADCGQRYLPLPRAHSTHILSRRHILHVHIQMISECRIWHYMCVVWAATTQQESSLFIYYMLSFPICNFMTDFMFVFLCIVLVCRSPRMPCSACWWAAGRSVTFATKRPSSIQEAIDRSWRKLTTIKIETKNTNTKMAGKSGFLCDASNNNNHSSQTYTVKREVYLSTIRGHRMAYFQARSSSDWRNSHTVACDCLCVWSDKPNDNDDYDILYYYCATAARAIAVYEYLGKMGHTENISTQSYWRTTNVACHSGILACDAHTRKLSEFGYKPIFFTSSMSSNTCHLFISRLAILQICAPHKAHLNDNKIVRTDFLRLLRVVHQCGNMVFMYLYIFIARY